MSVRPVLSAAHLCLQASSEARVHKPRVQSRAASEVRVDCEVCQKRLGARRPRGLGLVRSAGPHWGLAGH